jgi:hypothetical protein
MVLPKRVKVLPKKVYSFIFIMCVKLILKYKSPPSPSPNIDMGSTCPK